MHIHIPKTGGTAIEELFHSLDDMEWGPACVVGEQESDGRFFELQHLSAVEFRSYTNGEFEDFTFFALVRNPYQRLISEQTWRKSIATSTPRANMRWFDSLADFVEALPDDLDAEWETHIRSADRAEANVLIHIRPQHHFTALPPTHFNAAIPADPADPDQGLPEQDASIRLVRFEDLPEAIDPLFHACGVHAHNLRTPPPKDLRRHFTAEMLQKVNRVYRQDFATFGYPMIEELSEI